MPSRNDQPLLIQVAIRAVVVSTAWVSGIFVAIVAGAKIAELSLNTSLGLRSATSVFANSLGSSTHVDASQWSTGSFTPLYYSGTVRPTLISLFILWTLCRSALALVPSDASRKLRGSVAATFGIATALFISISSALAAGPISYPTESWAPGNLTRSTTQDFMTVLLICSLSIGVYFNQSKRGKAKFGIVANTRGTTLRWSLHSLRLFTKFFTLLALSAIVIFAIVTLIRPDFVNSTPAGSGSTHMNYRELVLPVIGILLYLPTLFFFSIAYVCGISLGFEIQGGSAFEQAISTFSNNYSTLTLSQSIFETSMSALGIALSVLAVFSAIAAGAWSARIVRPNAKWDRIWIQGLATSTVVLLALNWFASAKGSWTNNGVQAQHAVSGQIIADSGFVRYGLGSGSLAAFAVVLASLTAFSATRFSRTINFGLPRLSTRMTGVSDVDFLGTGSGSHRAFGRFVTLVATLALIVPIGASTFERAYAMTHNAKQIAEQQIRAIQTGDPKIISAEFGMQGDPNLWLPASVLKQATRDDKGNLVSSSIEMLNSNKEPWTLGQLDAAPKLVWKLGDQTSSWTVSIPGNTAPLLRWLSKAIYKVSASPLNVTVKGGDFYPKASATQIKVNGVSVKVGTYFGVPGFYHVTAPASGVIAATDTVLYVDNGDLLINAGNQANLSAATLSQVRATTATDLRSCTQITKELKSKCLPGDEIATASQQSSQIDIPYFDRITYTKIKATKPDCTEATQHLTSATSAQFESKCTQTVTFTANYITNAITEPIIQTGQSQTWVVDGYEDGSCIDYDTYYDYCNTYEQVPYGHYEYRTTEKVVGQRIITPSSSVSATYTSDVSFTHKVIVAQQKNKTFAVSSAMK